MSRERAPTWAPTVQALATALADPLRWRLLYVLQEQEQLVSDLYVLVDRVHPTVSRHLRILKDQGLVRQRRAGRHTYYRLAATPQATAVCVLLRHLRLAGWRGE
jgi:DNA-binding transcriptional ArsR family regulator